MKEPGKKYFTEMNMMKNLFTQIRHKLAGRLVLFLLLMLTAALFAIGCSASGAGTYEIGDIGPSGVGIVFYVTDGGLHGLEAAPADQSASPWIEGGSTQNTLNGNTLTAIGTGSANTDAIIAQTDHSTSAAEVCRDYTGGGFTDWFLPSKDELNELYIQRALFGGLSGGYYWSSSEDSEAANAWAHRFSDNDQKVVTKVSTNSVRAVRSF